MQKFTENPGTQMNIKEGEIKRWIKKVTFNYNLFFCSFIDQSPPPPLKSYLTLNVMENQFFNQKSFLGSKRNIFLGR